MHFLDASLFWWLLPLAGIPLVSHWLNRRYPRKFAFSSIADIRRTVAGRTRLFRWRDWLVLLLRTAALVALLLAFLKPVVATRQVETGGETRRLLLLVDHSLSMTCAEDGTTARTKARAEVKRLLDSLGPDDRFNLIRVDHAPAPAFPGFSTHREAALDFLDRSPAPLTPADFRAANHLAAELGSVAGGPLEIYYFSDFQRRDWADVNFTALPAGFRLFFISATADPQRPNRAIESLELGPGAVIAGGEAEVKVRVANHSPAPWHGKVEAGFGPAHARESEITLAPWSVGDVVLTIPVPAGGWLRLTAELPPDNLPADDRRHLVVQVREREEVVILTGTEAEADAPAPELFLTTAVNPYGGDQGVYRPKHLEPATLTPAALAASQRLIASRLPALGDTQAGTLTTFLRGGGGVILFLDGEADAANLEKLAALAGEPLPLRLTERLDSKHFGGGAMRVATGDFRSRFLRLFAGVRRQNLALLEFYEIYHAAATGSGKILLAYTDGTPALAECQIGLGTLLICNFSVAEASSNLARQRLFPAWIHELLTQICQTGSAAQEPFTVGDTIAGETWAAEATGQELLAPGGTAARSRMDVLGERLRVFFTTESTGFYHMPGADQRDLLAFAVNTDADQSDLRAMDPEVLPDRAGEEHPDAKYVGATANYDELRSGRPVAHWFLLAALGLLLVEGLLFKSNPARMLRN
ncbi:MAG: BatA domain-containing protein [Akkermansiaceae bacterium]|nr:BatA domain-containing protein [Akkermansiaceae bacterium]